jgi:hypothetical protein
VDTTTRVSGVTKQPTKEAAGDIKRITYGIAARCVKRALIAAAAAVTVEFKLKTAIRAVVTIVASELDKRHA